MPPLAITTKPGDKYRSIKRPRVYEALRKRGYNKSRAARISNAQAQKSYTLGQLEAFVSSPAYDADIAGLLALSTPALKAVTGHPGELIEPGVRRIHGNLCNVHGKYGPCDKALSGKKPTAAKKPARGRQPRKAAQTPEQRAQADAAKRQANADSVAKRMAETDTGLSPSGSTALLAFATGTQPNTMLGDGLARMGLVERAQDGTYRMTPTGRAAVAAMQAGDYQRAVDAVSRGSDAQGKRGERTAAQAKRQQDSAGKRVSAAVGRELARRERDAAAKKRAQERAAKKPAKAGSSGKKPEQVAEKPLKVAPTKRRARSSIPNVGSVGGAAKPKPEKAPAKQIAPALQEAAQALSDGKELSEADTLSLIRNGLARIVKGELILTAAGQRQTTKAYSFRVFKDASGKYRWVAQSSTAFQDRDEEIVSTKALADDCAFADETGSYGPLRWWHAPGLDLGACDFNAMHGRVLIESGTFKSEAIALKVAAAAPTLEISLGFLHLPTEPDATGVFHHIRKFERSLVPRGKASNRFTAFSVKELTMLDATKVAALKALGFSDDDITGLQANAAATEKTAADQGVAYKADEPQAVELPDIVINGVTYKAFPPKMDAPAEDAAVVEEDATLEMPMEEEPQGGLTLSPEDLAAITEVFQTGLAQVMGALDLEKKVAGHVQGLMAPYTAQKDSEQAERDEKIANLQTALKTASDQQTALKAQLDELLGLQPAVAPRASESAQTVINPWIPQDAQLLESIKAQLAPDNNNNGVPVDDRGVSLTEHFFNLARQ